MLHDRAKRRPLGTRVRAKWMELSSWGPASGGEAPRISMGRRPIRIAIRQECELVAEEPALRQEEARERLGVLGASWPLERPRLAIEGGTGLGKTTLAIAKCVEHVKTSREGSLLVVAPSRKRVTTTVGLVRSALASVGADPTEVQELIGRQPLDGEVGQTWSKTRFGCMNPVESRRAGTRGRQVKADVCGRCAWRGACTTQGYLGHTEQALRARVIVTTQQRLGSLRDEAWANVVSVICDEDVMPGLLNEFHVLESDLRRAERYIDQRRASEVLGAAGDVQGLSPRCRDLMEALPLLRATLGALRAHGARPPTPLLMLLPEEYESMATGEGARALRKAMPRAWTAGKDAAAAPRPSITAPAEWEQVRDGRLPRQVWGRFLDAVLADLMAGDSARAATVRVETISGRPRRARLRVLSFDERTLRHLRQRPLLLLDATLHPAIGPVLNVERHEIQYRQGRKVVQVLTGLLDLNTLRERCAGGWQLTERGRWIVATLAFLFAGQRGYVLCRKGLWMLLAKEGARYQALRHVRLVTHGHERGWDAERGASLFVVLGRHAKDTLACEREAHALRSVFRRLTGSIAGLDALEQPDRAMPFLGRGRVLKYRGEPVERVTRTPHDRLAARIQDADRVATVVQFMGRDRTGLAYVFLLRGDPTVPADALVHDSELAQDAVTARAALPQHWLAHVVHGPPVAQKSRHAAEAPL